MKLRISMVAFALVSVTAGNAPLPAQMAASAPPASAAAATLPGEAKQSYIRVRDFILKAVDKMPEQDYGFQPTPEIRSFAQVVNHITEAQTRICSGLNGQTRPAPAAGKTKAEVIAAVKATFDECDKAYDSVNESNMAQIIATGRVQRSKLALLYGNVSHDNEMYGTMSVYMRLKGIVPPSSDAPPAPPK